jgi:hypothetical protein
MPIAAAAGIALLARLSSPGEPSLTPEQLVARHLEAIGSAEARAAASPRLVEGTCAFEVRRGGAGSLVGRTRVASEGRRYGIDLRFGQSSYWGERVAFDGRKVEVGFMQAMRRSTLGDFLNTYDALVREGLLGGVLSTAWPLLDLDDRKPRLKYGGLETVEGRQLHRLGYKAAKGQADVSVDLYFEPETFRHVRTVYALRRRPGMSGAIEDSAGQLDTSFRIEETFASFAAAGSLVLPKRWTLAFSLEGPARSSLMIWTTVIEGISTALPASPSPGL